MHTHATYCTYTDMQHTWIHTTSRRRYKHARLAVTVLVPARRTWRHAGAVGDGAKPTRTERFGIHSGGKALRHLLELAGRLHDLRPMLTLISVARFCMAKTRKEVVIVLLQHRNKAWRYSRTKSLLPLLLLQSLLLLLLKLLCLLSCKSLLHLGLLSTKGSAHLCAGPGVEAAERRSTPFYSFRRNAMAAFWGRRRFASG